MIDSACIICDASPTIFSWTDTHGVAQCQTCGAPWRLMHYEGEGAKSRSVDRPPSLCIRDEMAGWARLFYQDTGHRLSAIWLGLSFPGGFDVASREDITFYDQYFRDFKS